MPDRQVEFHPEAAAEAEAALTWYRERSVRAASEFLGELERAIAAILRYPGRWPEMRGWNSPISLETISINVVYREVSWAIQSWRLLMSPSTRILERMRATLSSASSGVTILRSAL